MRPMLDVETDHVQGVDFFESDPAHSRSVALPLLLAGTLLTIHTRNTLYRMLVLDGSARRVLITGGWLFPESTEAEVIGATDDDGVKVGWIVEGLQLELSTDWGPVITSMVESVGVGMHSTSFAEEETDEGAITDR